jgi:hypothetical protein
MCIIANLVKLYQTNKIDRINFVTVMSFKFSKIIVICITRPETALLRVRVRFGGRGRRPRPSITSTRKTVFGRVIHKIFCADN